VRRVTGSTMTHGCACRMNLTVVVTDATTGRELSRQSTHNAVVTAGRNLIRDLLYGASSAQITHFALGTNNTAVVATDTALGSEVFRDTLTSRVADEATLTVKYYLASGSANGNTLKEAGLLTALSGGTLYARSVLASEIVKTSSIAITFTWELEWLV
jgi:hypothetical protein